MPPLRSTALVVVFVASLVFTLLQPGWARDAAPERFVAALQHQRALVQPGDTVLVQPPWRDDVVDALRAASVVATQTAITAAFAPRHGDPWPPVVVVADSSWPLPAALRDRATNIIDDDGISLVRIAEVSTAGPFDLARASVSVSGPDGDFSCPWNPERRRHVCVGLPEWMTVGQDTLTIGGRSERCFWAHPKTGHSLVIDYGVVDVAGRVSFSMALTDSAADNPAGAAVQGTLVVGSHQEQLSVQRQRGFHDVDVAAAGRQAVRVELRTDNDGQRHTCYRLATGP